MKKNKGGVAAIYQMITDRIVSMLQDNLVPWRMGWNQVLAPQNFVSKKPYRGINSILTSMCGYRSPYFLTYRQMVELGGSLKDDARGKSVPIVFWSWRDVADKNGTEKSVPFLRYYRVFNVEHIEGLQFSEAELYPQYTGSEKDGIDAAERIVAAMPNKPKFQIGVMASYNPRRDVLTMPDFRTFEHSEEFYSTLFHELTHSTGYSSRLDRDSVMDRRPGDKPTYAKEELIAELGAAFLCAQSGITEATIHNSAAYIKGWLRALKNDPKLLIQAAGKAQKAADYIQNITFTEATGTDVSEVEAEHAVITNDETESEPVEVEPQDQPTIVPALVEGANTEAAEFAVPVQGSLFPVEPVVESPKRKRRVAAKKQQKPAPKKGNALTRIFGVGKAKKNQRKQG